MPVVVFLLTSVLPVTLTRPVEVRPLLAVNVLSLATVRIPVDALPLTLVAPPTETAPVDVIPLLAVRVLPAGTTKAPTLAVLVTPVVPPTLTAPADVIPLLAVRVVPSATFNIPTVAVPFTVVVPPTETAPADVAPLFAVRVLPSATFNIPTVAVPCTSVVPSTVSKLSRVASTPLILASCTLPEVVRFPPTVVVAFTSKELSLAASPVISCVVRSPTIFTFLLNVELLSNVLLLELTLSSAPFTTTVFVVLPVILTLAFPAVAAILLVLLLSTIFSVGSVSVFWRLIFPE